MAKPLVIQIKDDQIVFYSDYLYKDLNGAVKPGNWKPDYPKGPERDRPGAWIYPATPEIAARLHAKFEHIIASTGNNQIDPCFTQLAEAGRDNLRLCVEWHEHLFTLAIPYDPAIIPIFHKITDAYFDRNKKVWTVPATSFHADRIREVFERDAYHIWHDAKIFPEFAKRFLSPIIEPPYNSKTTAWAHQKRAYNRAFEKPGFMLALDMGTGKSKVAVDLVVNRDCRRVLIVCPKAVIDVWPKQFELHAAPEFNQLVITLKKGMLEQKTAQAAEAVARARNDQRPLVVIINYESAWREPFREFALDANFDCVIADESHKIKAPGGKAALFMREIGKITKWRLALTGTPMPHSPADIYAQYRFLDSSIFGSRFQGYTDRRTGEYIPGFLDEYATGFDDYRRPTGWRQQELNAKIYRIAERVKSTDVLDLPPTQHIEYYFDLESKARKIYNDLDAKFAAMLDDATVSVNNKLTQVLRFAQLTGGFFKSDDGELIEVDSGKRDLLEEILDDLEPNEPVVVFARFQKDLLTIHEVCKKLERSSLELSGRINQLEKWQNGEAPVLAVQIQAGGAGVDCTRACHVIYMSVGYSNGDYEQSLKRADRPGQTRPVRFYHLLCNNSIDIKIQRALEAKASVVEAILGIKVTEDNHE